MMLIFNALDGSAEQAVRGGVLENSSSLFIYYRGQMPLTRVPCTNLAPLMSDM